MTPVSTSVTGENRIKGMIEIRDIVRELIEAQLSDRSEAEIKRLQYKLNSSYDEFIKKYGLTQEEVSEKVGKSRSSIANSLRLLKLPLSISEYVSDGIISAGHAKALLPLEDEEKMIYLCNLIIKDNLSVRDVEKAVKNMMAEKKTQKKKSRDKFFDEVELSLKDTLKRKIKISSTAKNKGTITIEFFDKDDLKNFVKFFDENK